ncbi:MAG TPA: AAA family ATPase [Solirubrobacterales bacterium]|jgi:energy-coupling factor transporter ATP-binding protein EcfA2|nr:AAA family ATPase [Solirubrobacterales bacterium]
MADLSGRPLIDTAADSRLYAPRREHRVLKKSVEQRLNVLLTGTRGSGKTTLLRQLLLDLRNDGHAAVFVDGKLASDAYSFLQLVRFQLGEAPNLPQILRERYSQAFAPRPNLGDANALLDLIDSMRVPEEAPERTALLIDGLPSPQIAHTLFGRLRDELWQLPFNWVIAVEDRERAALLEPPADAFFDRQIDLSPLGAGEQMAILERRVELTDRRALESLIEASDGNPRMLLALARDTLEGGEAIEDLLSARAMREMRASNLSRPASMLLAELESMGSASASDEELLKRMGWTRPRAAQVFAELEGADLVTSREEKGHGGRPRKVYRPQRGMGEA